MIWAIIIAIGGYILFRFIVSLSKDNEDLMYQSLPEKFSVIVAAFNQAAFQGLGSVTVLDKRQFNLYRNGASQIINFQYGTGNLTLTWKLKYFQKEVVHEKTFPDVRNLSIFDQQKIADQMLKEVMIVMEKHKIDVLGSAL
jgi:hypothetical protein